jgi:hypothetical protein
MQVDDRPRAVFGRRGREIRGPVTLANGTGEPARGIGHILSLFCLVSLLLATAGAILWTLLAIENINAESAQAELKVIQIVNQAITHLPRSGPVGLFSPGWFHPDAIKPDFNNVDIRATQEFLYDGYSYVTSDVTPSEMFIGSELEFNSMTKYFYTNRALPKKRLSVNEMVEINGLYRVIGQAERAPFIRWLTIGGQVVVGFGLGFILLLLIRRPLRHAPS